MQAQVEKLISNNFFRQNDLLVDDFRHANTIYSPMVEVLKGKGTRAKPQHIPSTVKMVLPYYILTEHRDVTLAADFIVVNGNFFLIPSLASSISALLFPSRTARRSPL